MTAAAAPPDFERDVYPILQRRCLECHGANKQAGDLRLDDRRRIPDSVLGKGSVDDSELVRRITLPAGHEEHMPAVGQPLSESQQKILIDWVAAGAQWPESFVAGKHWAYVAPQRPALPSVAQNDWCKSPIEYYFVLKRLESEGVKPSPGRRLTSCCGVCIST